MATDLHIVRDRARRAFERGRVRHAALAVGLLLPVLALVVVIAPRAGWAAAWSAGAALVAFVALWRGQAWARGVLGVLGGVLFGGVALALGRSPAPTRGS